MLQPTWEKEFANEHDLIQCLLQHVSTLRFQDVRVPEDCQGLSVERTLRFVHRLALRGKYTRSEIRSRSLLRGIIRTVALRTMLEYLGRSKRPTRRIREEINEEFEDASAIAAFSLAEASIDFEQNRRFLYDQGFSRVRVDAYLLRKADLKPSEIVSAIRERYDLRVTTDCLRKWNDRYATELDARVDARHSLNVKVPA